MDYRKYGFGEVIQLWMVYAKLQNARNSRNFLVRKLRFVCKAELSPSQRALAETSLKVRTGVGIKTKIVGNIYLFWKDITDR